MLNLLDIVLEVWWSHQNQWYANGIPVTRTCGVRGTHRHVVQKHHQILPKHVEQNMQSSKRCKACQINTNVIATHIDLFVPGF